VLVTGRYKSPSHSDLASQRRLAHAYATAAKKLACAKVYTGEASCHVLAHLAKLART